MEHCVKATVALSILCFWLLLDLDIHAAAQPAPRNTMTEAQASFAAIKILKGNPYGDTDRDVARTIHDSQLIVAGSVCGRKVERPVWQFHVMLPEKTTDPVHGVIDGFLDIDARTGKMVCAGLPFLD
jgi:hypothetical protein